MARLACHLNIDSNISKTRARELRLADGGAEFLR